MNLLKESKKVLISKSIFIAILITVSTSVHINTLWNGLVFDDVKVILENPWIRDIKYIPDILFGSVLSFKENLSSSNYYRPVMYLIYMLTYHIFGLKPWGFHLTSILFHAINTVLVFFVASEIIGNSGGMDKKSRIRGLTPAFLAPLLFATHPINTDAVAFASAISDLSFTSFILLSFYLYIKSTDRSQRQDSKGNRQEVRKNRYLMFGFWPLTPGTLPFASGFYLFSLFFFFLSLLTKETAISLLLLLVIYDYSIGLERDHSRPPTNGSRFLFHLPPFTLHHLLRRYLPYLIVVGAYLPLRIYALGGLAPRYPVQYSLSTYQYVINVFPLILQYVEKLLFPVSLNFYPIFRPVYSMFEPKAIGSLLFTMALLILIYRIRRSGIPFLCLLWIVTPLLPVLYLPGIGGLEAKTVFSERYLYLSSVGFVILVSYGLMMARRWLEVNDRRTKIIIGRATLTSLLIVVLGLYSLGTIKRNYIWHDEYTLWKDTVKKSPDSVLVRNNLGLAYAKKSLWDRAIAEYREAIRISPDLVNAHYNLGVAYAKKGLWNMAIAEYREVIKINPDFAEAHNNLGLAYAKKGLWYQAITEYKETLRINPDLVDTHYNLGVAYSEKGLWNMAIAEYKEVVKINPDFAEAHNNLGVVYAEKGLLDQAIAEYREALRINPNLVDAHFNLGVEYAGKGLLDQAIAEYREALRIRPDLANGHYNIGVIYAERGLWDLAIVEFKEVLRINPNFKQAEENLKRAMHLRESQ